MPPKPRTIAPEKRALAEELLRQEPPLSMLAISKRVGISTSTVKKIADQAGIDRSGSAPVAANAARRNLAEARRAALELDFLDDVDAARNLFHAAVSQSDGRTAKDAMWAAATAYEKSQRIADAARAHTDVTAAKGMLGDLAAAIRGAFSGEDDDE